MLSRTTRHSWSSSSASRLNRSKHRCAAGKGINLIPALQKQYDSSWREWRSALLFLYTCIWRSDTLYTRRKWTTGGHWTKCWVVAKLFWSGKEMYRYIALGNIPWRMEYIMWAVSMRLRPSLLLEETNCYRPLSKAHDIVLFDVGVVGEQNPDVFIPISMATIYEVKWGKGTS
jgi:hypothetical protein